jgi:CheY-like chemotaxis protein
MEKSILIVEDEFLVALDLKEMLEADGWRVIGPAASVKSAIELLEGETPTVALLDVQLGKEMSTRVAETLQHLEIPFVFTSAYSSPHLAGHGALAKSPRMEKPIDEKRLLALLARLAGA